MFDWIGSSAQCTKSLSYYPFDLFIPGNISTKIWPLWCASTGNDLTKVFISNLNNFFKWEIAHTGKNHTFSLKVGCNELLEITLLKIWYTLTITQNIPPQRMVFKNQIVKVILYGILRGILVHRHFLQNHCPLFFNLFLRKGSMKSNIRKQLYWFLKITIQHRSIKTNFLFGGIGV